MINDLPSAGIRIGILTVSDRASRGVYEDRGGPAIRDYFNRVIVESWTDYSIVIPDERGVIEQTLCQLCDENECCLVVTTGGTGPTVRDVTPEATESVADKLMPGFGELMRQISLQYVPTAILSRQTACIRKQSLIINLPGKPKAIDQCLDAVMPAVPYCIDLIGGPRITTNPEFVTSFRPAE